MMQSMTGFASKETVLPVLGKICLELRSTNHKFLEVVFRLPEGFLSLEDKIKKTIEAKIKRGRIICLLSCENAHSGKISLNKNLLKNYMRAFKDIKQQFHIKGELSIDALMHLPGILSLPQEKISPDAVWGKVKILLTAVTGELVRMRRKEGQAIYKYLNMRNRALNAHLENITKRFKAAIAAKVLTIDSDEERTAFLKNSDITEEMERLAFHCLNFKHKLSISGPVGKELDFITQEMQREANTMGAKSFDKVISNRVIQAKSLIEKMREQIQNIE